MIALTDTERERVGKRLAMNRRKLDRFDRHASGTPEDDMPTVYERKAGRHFDLGIYAIEADTELDSATQFAAAAETLVLAVDTAHSLGDPTFGTAEFPIPLKLQRALLAALLSESPDVIDAVTDRLFQLPTEYGGTYRLPDEAGTGSQPSPEYVHYQTRLLGALARSDHDLAETELERLTQFQHPTDTAADRHPAARLQAAEGIVDDDADDVHESIQTALARHREELESNRTVERVILCVEATALHILASRNDIEIPVASPLITPE